MKTVFAELVYLLGCFLLITAIIKLFAYSAILFELGAAILSSVLILPIIQFFVLKAINTKEVKILQSRTEDERQSIYFSQLISNGINYKELKWKW